MANEPRTPSLPIPPRRLKAVVSTTSTLNNMDDIDEPLFKPAPFEPTGFDKESPDIGNFSVDNVVNAFKSRKQHQQQTSVDGLAQESQPTVSNTPSDTLPTAKARSTSVPPPPRPARDARRPSAKSSSPPSPVSGGNSSGALGRSSTPSPERAENSSKSNQQSAGYDGYGAKPPTSAFGPAPSFMSQSDGLPEFTPLPSVSLPPTSASPFQDAVVFREFTATRGVGNALSEREKAKKWDALLKKSEQAGGTLHLTLGNPGDQLDSDQLTLNSSILQLDP